MTHSDKAIARIVGGGFVGLACAIELQAEGFQVELFDASADHEAASYGNAGHIATEQLAPIASWSHVRQLRRLLYSRGGPVAFPVRQIARWGPFGLRLLAACAPPQYQRGFACNRALLGQALLAWRDMLRRVGKSELLCTAGHQVVWESAASAARGTQSWLSADLGTTSATPIDGETLRAISRRFAGKPVAGLQFSGTGHIRDLRSARIAMREAFINAGGTWRKQAVKKVRRTSEGSQLVVKDVHGEQLLGRSQDLVVVCAGVHSADLLADDFGRLPMIAERGYHLQFGPSALAGQELDCPLVFEDRSLIVTPFSHGLRMASFTEFSHHAAPADAGKWRHLKRHAKDLGIDAERHRPSTWLGCRPTLPDYLPALGGSRKVPNLILACGHNHLGLTLAAVTGRLVRQIACRKDPDVDITALEPQRYLPNF